MPSFFKTMSQSDPPIQKFLNLFLIPVHLINCPALAYLGPDMAGVCGPASTYYMQLTPATVMEIVGGVEAALWRQKFVTFASEGIKKTAIQLMALQLISLIL